MSHFKGKVMKSGISGLLFFGRKMDSKMLLLARCEWYKHNDQLDFMIMYLCDVASYTFSFSQKNTCCAK